MHDVMREIEMAVTLHQQGNIQDAINLFGSVICENPEFLYPGHVPSLRKMKKSDLEKSYDLLCDAIRVSPENSNYHLYMGHLQVEREEYQKAREAYTEASTLDNSIENINYYIGNTYWHQNDYENAITEYLYALDMQPDQVDVYLSLADSFLQLKNYQAAELAYKNLLLLKNNDPGVKNKLLEVLIAQSKQQEALDFIELLHDDPDNATDMNAIGNVLFNDTQFTLAEAAYKKALKLDPDCHDAKLNYELVETLKDQKNSCLYLALPKGEGFGWGTCGKYLTSELKTKLPVCALDYENWDVNGNKTLPGTVLSAIGAEDLAQIYKVRGTRNIGYTFFERNLTKTAKQNATQYDLVLAGSGWAKERLQESGIENSDVLIQGIDENIFYPIDKQVDNQGFFIFSGGKFELRKGQDLVLKAIQVLQQKYDDIILVNAWVNHWPQSMATMSLSDHIQYKYNGDGWDEVMNNLYLQNNINPEKVITLGITPQDQLRDIYSKTHLGLFPNRSEGGTNLVLMEYMACAKPVIATNCTGHTDIVTGQNSLLLNKLAKRDYFDNGVHYASWDEPDLDEIISQIEYAYHNRDAINNLGIRAGEYLKQFTWERTAQSLVDTLSRYGIL